MAPWRGRWLIKPVLYTTSLTTVGGGLIYWSNRPRTIPGSEPAVVPPPSYSDGGRLRPPRFPLVKAREEQIAALRWSGDARRDGLGPSAKAGVATSRIGGAEGAATPTTEDNETYDLLIIGGGATGSGIALDAVTRGLRVALVERDDFGSGTSSKSTKLVHGGVRYLEKAFWELDYNQSVSEPCVA